MAEVLFNDVVTLVDGGPAVSRDVNISQDIEGPWAVVAMPVDSGPGTPVNIVIDRLFMGVAKNLVASTPLTNNVPNAFDRTEVATRVRVSLTPGVTAPDGGVRLQLVGTRR